MKTEHRYVFLKRALWGLLVVGICIDGGRRALAHIHPYEKRTASKMTMEEVKKEIGGELLKVTTDYVKSIALGEEGRCTGELKVNSEKGIELLKSERQIASFGEVIMGSPRWDAALERCATLPNVYRTVRGTESEVHSKSESYFLCARIPSGLVEAVFTVRDKNNPNQALDCSQIKTLSQKTNLMGVLFYTVYWLDSEGVEKKINYSTESLVSEFSSSW